MMGLVWSKPDSKPDSKSRLEKLYEVIPGNILELTKKNLIKWTNLGCIIDSWVILEDSDMYEGRFVKRSYQKAHPIVDVKLQLVVSDEDCILIIGRNLISNSQVCRLKNWILSTEKKDTSAICRLLTSYNQELGDIYQEDEEHQKQASTLWSLDKEVSDDE